MRFSMILAVLAALAGTTGTATAAGPPVVNELTRLDQIPFQMAGTNCATGSPALVEGRVSGTVHTRVAADGTVKVSLHLRGSSTLDDLDPVPDGIVDASTTFVLNSTDAVFASGAEIHQLTENGTLTLASDGSRLSVHALVQLHVGRDGSVRLDNVRIRCN